MRVAGGAACHLKFENPIPEIYGSLTRTPARLDRRALDVGQDVLAGLHEERRHQQRHARDPCARGRAPPLPPRRRPGRRVRVGQAGGSLSSIGEHQARRLHQRGRCGLWHHKEMLLATQLSPGPPCHTHRHASGQAARRAHSKSGPASGSAWRRAGQGRAAVRGAALRARGGGKPRSAPGGSRRTHEQHVHLVREQALVAGDRQQHKGELADLRHAQAHRQGRAQRVAKHPHHRADLRAARARLVSRRPGLGRAAGRAVGSGRRMHRSTARAARPELAGHTCRQWWVRGLSARRSAAVLRAPARGARAPAEQLERTRRQAAARMTRLGGPEASEG